MKDSRYMKGKLNRMNIGIVGMGRIGRIHAENLMKLRNVVIKSVSDINHTELLPWAEGMGISTVTANNMDIINDPDIDAILICSTTNTHIDLILKAAAAGKHIFCEKPISYNLEMTRYALRAVKKSGVKLQTGFNRRFDANFMRVRESVMAGEIGAPHIVKVTSRDPSPPSLAYIKNSGGIFIDMSIHDFDMVRYLSDSDVEEVFVQGGVLIDPLIGELGDIDTAIISLRFENGALGVIDNSRQAVYGYDQRVEVFGSKGNISVQNDFPNSVEWSTQQGVFKDKPKYFFLERYKESYRSEIEAFIDCILNDKAMLVDGNDGLQAELIAHASKLSLMEKRPVRISEVMASLDEED